MPELPQIESDQQLKVPETVGIQRLNLERPNPALEALREQGHDVEMQASFLSANINRQKIATDLVNSDSNAINAFTDVTAKTAGIQDPDEQLKQRGIQSQAAINGILANNPGIAPHIKGNLQLRQAGFRPGQWRFVLHR